MYREEKAPEIEEDLKRAKVKAIIEELDCFEPRRIIKIKYSGPRVKDIIKRAPRIIREAMRITGTKVYLDSYFVDTTDPNKITFHILQYGVRDFDDKTSMKCYLNLKSGVLKPDGSGSVTLEFFPVLVTKWDRSNWFRRTPIFEYLLKIWTYIFYNEQRRKYLKLCREYAEDMIKRAKEALKLVQSVKYPST